MLILCKSLSTDRCFYIHGLTVLKCDVINHIQRNAAVYSIDNTIGIMFPEVREILLRCGYSFPFKEFKPRGSVNNCVRGSNQANGIEYPFAAHLADVTPDIRNCMGSKVSDKVPFGVEKNCFVFHKIMYYQHG